MRTRLQETGDRYKQVQQLRSWLFQAIRRGDRDMDSTLEERCDLAYLLFSSKMEYAKQYHGSVLFENYAENLQKHKRNFTKQFRKDVHQETKELDALYKKVQAAEQRMFGCIRSL